MCLQALSCTFTGTFLLSLGVDLAVNRQNGVSRGLRHLLDGNDAHILVRLSRLAIDRSLSWIYYIQALRDIPYKPLLSTQIILGVSIALA